MAWHQLRLQQVQYHKQQRLGRHMDLQVIGYLQVQQYPRFSLTTY